MPRINSTSFFLLVLGFLAGCVFSIFGLQFLATNIALVAAVTVGIVGLIIFISVLFYVFREQILSRLCGYTITEAKDLSEPAYKLINSIASRNMPEIETSSKELLGKLLTRYSWYQTQRWIIATLIAVIGTFTAFGGTALIYQQNELITRQNELILNQNQAIKIANQPQFFLGIEYKLDDNKIAVDDMLKVKYLGGFYSDLDTDIITFIKATYKANHRTPTISKQFALIGYYTLSLRYVGGEGIILTMQGAKNNNSLYANAKRAYAQLCSERHGFGDLILQRFARFKYKDVYGELHTVYYFVSNSTIKIDPNRGESVFENWKKKIANSEVIDIEKIDALKLLNNLLGSNTR